MSCFNTLQHDLFVIRMWLTFSTTCSEKKVQQWIDRRGAKLTNGAKQYEIALLSEI